MFSVILDPRRFLRKSDAPKVRLIIDEPDVALHPDWIDRVVAAWLDKQATDPLLGVVGVDEVDVDKVDVDKVDVDKVDVDKVTEIATKLLLRNASKGARTSHLPEIWGFLPDTPPVPTPSRRAGRTAGQSFRRRSAVDFLSQRMSLFPPSALPRAALADEIAGSKAAVSVLA